MSQTQHARTRWGDPPWPIDFHAEKRVLPGEVDVAVVGGGFAGLTAAAWLRRVSPHMAVAVLEADRIGAGASGRTGGIALAETAGGDLPGLGDVLEDFRAVLDDLHVDCDFRLSGVWEIGRRGGRSDSPISWKDSGRLRVVREVPGGSVDPGKLVSGLARSAHRLGAELCEGVRVLGIEAGERLGLALPNQELRARYVLFATNAESLELSGMGGRAQPKFTLAVAAAPLDANQLRALGLAVRKPFYTVDLPYLWGRVLENNGIVFGSGLVHLRDDPALRAVDVGSGRAGELLEQLEARVRGLHPALHSVRLTHRWGGPILFPEDGFPVFARHPVSTNALVLAGFSGQGVTLAVRLGRWAAEVIAGRREPPKWAHSLRSAGRS